MYMCKNVMKYIECVWTLDVFDVSFTITLHALLFLFLRRYDVIAFQTPVLQFYI